MMLRWIRKVKISTLLLIFAGAAFCVWIKTTTHAPSLSSTLCCVFLRGATPAHPNRTNTIAPPTQRLAWPAWHFRPTSKLLIFLFTFLGAYRVCSTTETCSPRAWNSQKNSVQNIQPQKPQSAAGRKVYQAAPYFRDKFCEMRNSISALKSFSLDESNNRIKNIFFSPNVHFDS